MSLAIGAKAPDFTLKNAAAKSFTLSKNLGEKPCIIFFYPKDFTSGCTKEVCGFRDNYNEFQAAGIDLVGISTDDESSHFNFIRQYKLPFELLSDTSGKVSAAYGAKLPFMNVSSRITFLLDETHRIQAIHKGLFLASDHISAMLKAIRKVA
jgi:peroxiredoxin Q/BCP